MTLFAMAALTTATGAVPAAAARLEVYAISAIFGLLVSGLITIATEMRHDHQAARTSRR